MSHSPVTRSLLALLAATIIVPAVAVGFPSLAEAKASDGHILLVANTSGSWQIYRVNPDGSSPLQLTNLPPTFFESWSPVYSPDGTKIAFCFAVDDGPVDIYVMDADGGNLTQVTHDGASLAPHWSPDGQRLVFGRIADTGVGVVTTMRIDGSDVRSLTSKYWDSFGGVYTPDGKQIVYYSQEGGYVAVVWIMNVNGAHKRSLTEPVLEGFPGDVSPDGGRIAFVNHTNVNLPNSIFTMDLDGGHLRQITSVPDAHDVSPTYSPDSASIAFASDRDSVDASLDVFTMKADGAHVQPIGTNLTLGGCPDRGCLNPYWGPKP